MSPIYVTALSLQHVDLTIGAHGLIDGQTVALVSSMTHPSCFLCPRMRLCVCAPAPPANLVQGVAWGCLGGERKAARISRSCSLILMSHFVKVSNQNQLLRNISGSAAWLLPKT